MSTLATLRLGACAALLLPTLALAQPAPTPAPVATEQAAPALSQAAAAAVNQRINALKVRLGITPAEEASWDAFAKTMRDNAADTHQLFAQRTADAGTMTAVMNMRSYAAITRAYADNTERLSTAFDTLYASLTDAQKQAADAMFREQAAEGQKPALR
jgi:protein CpxP